MLVVKAVLVLQVPLLISILSSNFFLWDLIRKEEAQPYWGLPSFILKLHEVSAGRYARDKTSRKCWVLHDSDILVNILYPRGCGSCLEQLGQRKDGW